MAVADEEGIRDLDRLKAATAALADPRKTTPEAAETDHRDGPPDLLLQRGPPLDRDRQPRDGDGAGVSAGRLRTADDPATSARNLVVLINPVSEPDGRDKAVDWFYRYLKGKTDSDNLPEPGRRRTGATTSSTTTTATRIRRRSRSRAPSIGCSTTTTRRSSTTCTSRFRCCTPGTAPGRTTRTSIRSSSTSGSRCRSTRSGR